MKNSKHFKSELQLTDAWSCNLKEHWTFLTMTWSTQTYSLHVRTTSHIVLMFIRPYIFRQLLLALHDSNTIHHTCSLDSISPAQLSFKPWAHFITIDHIYSQLRKYTITIQTIDSNMVWFKCPRVKRVHPGLARSSLSNIPYPIPHHQTPIQIMRANSLPRLGRLKHINIVY